MATSSYFIAKNGVCTPVTCATTCTQSPIVCGSTCVVGAVTCGTTCVTTPLVNATCHSGACMCSTGWVQSPCFCGPASSAATATCAACACKLTGPACTNGSDSWFRSSNDAEGWYNSFNGNGLSSRSGYICSYGSATICASGGNLQTNCCVIASGQVCAGGMICSAACLYSPYHQATTCMHMPTLCVVSGTGAFFNNVNVCSCCCVLSTGMVCSASCLQAAGNIVWGSTACACGGCLNFSGYTYGPLQYATSTGLSICACGCICAMCCVSAPQLTAGSYVYASGYICSGTGMCSGVACAGEMYTTGWFRNHTGCYGM